MKGTKVLTGFTDDQAVGDKVKRQAQPVGASTKDPQRDLRGEDAEGTGL